jgi:hypothetical protein
MHGWIIKKGRLSKRKAKKEHVRKYTQDVFTFHANPKYFLFHPSH